LDTGTGHDIGPRSFAGISEPEKAIKVMRGRHFRILGLAAAMLMLPAGPAGAVESGTPNAVYPVRTYDFGTVKQGEKVAHCFVVRNEGKAPLTTSGMHLPSPELVARAPASIAPGQAGQVCVELDTSSMSRRIHTWVIIDSNDPIVPRLPLYINGMVNAPIDLLPYGTVFASLFTGESATRGVIVVNNQKLPLKILGLESPSQHFKASIKTRKPNQIYEVTIEIPPTVPPGHYREFAYLKTDSRERPRLQIVVDLLIKNEIFAFPTELNFGQISLAAAGGHRDDTGSLTASFLVKKREGQFRITKIDCDVRGLQLTQTPQAASDAYRFDIAMPAKQLKPGPLNGSIRLHTDDEKVPEIIVPIRAVIQ
jgi:hypothetical protein